MVKKNKITLAEAMDSSGLKTEFIAKMSGYHVKRFITTNMDTLIFHTLAL